MGNIPLPALSIRPPEQQPDVAENFVRLKSLLGQQQLQQQQIQGAQLENQQRQQQINDQQASTKAMQEWDGKDITQVPGLLIKHGASAPTVFAAQNQIMAQREKLSQIAKNDAETGGNNLKNLATKNDMLLGKLNGVTDGPGLITAANEAAQQGLIDPQHAQIASQFAQLPPSQFKSSLENFKKSLMGQKEQFDQLMKQSEIAKNAAQGQEATANTSKIQQATGIASALAPAQLAKTKAEAAEAGQRARLGVGGIAAAEAAGKIKGEMSAMGGMGGAAGPPNPNLQPGQRDEAYLGTLQGNLQTTVKAIAEGRMPLPSGFALKSPYWQNMLSMVAKYDPSFDAVNYNARSKTRNDFTSGKSSQQVNALNTAIGHLDQLSKATDDLNNTRFPTVNKIENFFSQQAGSPKVTNYQAIVKPVADELTRVWRGTGGAEADIKDRLNALSASNSPEQLHQAIAEIGDLMKSKLDALGEQYGQGMGTAPIRMVTPGSAKTLERLTQQAGGNKPAATQAGSAMTATGPNGHKIVVKDGKWVDAQTGAPIQ